MEAVDEERTKGKTSRTELDYCSASWPIATFVADGLQHGACSARHSVMPGSEGTVFEIHKLGTLAPPNY
jgi:hypothetical protein